MNFGISWGPLLFFIYDVVEYRISIRSANQKVSTWWWANNMTFEKKCLLYIPFTKNKITKRKLIRSFKGFLRWSNKIALFNTLVCCRLLLSNFVCFLRSALLFFFISNKKKEQWFIIICDMPSNSYRTLLKCYLCIRYTPRFYFCL